jgi:epoxyqueuosine reductase
LGLARTVRRPVESGIEKRECRHICQEVCPWNSFATPSTEEAFLAREGLDGPSLIEWMTMTQEEFSARFKGSPIKRAKRRGLLRNVAVALGNWGAPEAVPALAVALNDEEPLVRGHAAWALGRIGTEAARQALHGRAEVEEDAWVREEISEALQGSRPPTPVAESRRSL